MVTILAVRRSEEWVSLCMLGSGTSAALFLGELLPIGLQGDLQD